MEVARTVVIDLSANTLVNFLSKLQKERNLSSDEMELVMMRAMNEVKSVKELSYANKILDLTYRIQQLEKQIPEEPEGEEEKDG